MDQKSSGGTPLNPEVVQTLPENLLASLKLAVEQGDMIHFSELLDEIGTNNRDLRDSLSALADRYEYEKLLTLLGQS